MAMRKLIKFFSCFFICMLFPLAVVSAQMKVMGDDALDRVVAGTGLSLMIKDVTMSFNIKSFAFDTLDNPGDVTTAWSHNAELYSLLFGQQDADGFQFESVLSQNSSSGIEFKNIVLHGGRSGDLLLDVLFDSGESFVTADLFTIDDASSLINGQTLLEINVPQWQQNLHLFIENIILAGTDIGSFDMGNIDVPFMDVYLSAHGHGIDWQIDIQQHMDEIKYTYNNTGDNFSASNITLAKTAAGLPENPADWSFDGAFSTGDINNNNPATLDIITLDSNNVTSILLNLPMQGTIRTENIHLGSQDFGPIAIDGINVHHMRVMLDAGNF
jgi:hypothetical protein